MDSRLSGDDVPNATPDPGRADTQGRRARGLPDRQPQRGDADSAAADADDVRVAEERLHGAHAGGTAPRGAIRDSLCLQTPGA